MTQDGLARAVDAETRGESGTAFTTRCQANGGDLLAVADRHLCPRANQLRHSFGKDFALTQRIETEEFADAEDQLDTATTTGNISHASTIPTMNGGRRGAAQRTAGGRMRRDDRNLHLV